MTLCIWGYITHSVKGLIIKSNMYTRKDLELLESVLIVKNIMAFIFGVIIFCIVQ